MRIFIAAVVVLLLAAVGAFVVAGNAAGPSIQIVHPEKLAGAATPLEVTIDAPQGTLSSWQIAFEQNAAVTPIAGGGKDSPVAAPSSSARDVKEGDLLRVTMTLAGSEIKAGPARIRVTATRPVLFGLRHVTSEATRDIQVRLEKPHVSVVSTKHYVNLGGSEMVVYRATPQDVMSGVTVGDLEYPGFPASGATVDGIKITDPALHIAFFALRYDQDLNAPMRVFARDDAGNTATAEFDHKTFPKAFKKSTIPLDDKFLDRVVPAILQGTTEVKPEGSQVEKFVVINSELRKKNAATIASLAKQTAPEMLWKGIVFHPFTNTKVESAFADFRTYLYQGREVDRQVHLGFDLAAHAGMPIVAANRGKVLYASELGIYGNCVIIDHGMGVQSLYGHLSSIDVQVGAMVEKEQEIGRSGMTGLAAGDHLHFTMLVGGQMVNPVEWWDPHWIEDRILRKLRDAR